MLADICTNFLSILIPETEVIVALSYDTLFDYIIRDNDPNTGSSFLCSLIHY